MKWFKHMAASGHDPDIGAIIDIFGFKGYYLFFRTVEIMSTEFKTNNPGKNTFNFQWFLGQFPRRIDRETLLKFLNFTDEIGRITYSLNGKRIMLNCPKLKDLTDEYTDKLIKQKSGEKPDNHREHRIRSKKKEEEDKNKDSRNKEFATSDIELTDFLIKGIKSNDPKAKTPLKDSPEYEKWVNQIRLCRESDKRSKDEIKAMIIFSQNDEFWSGNILSATKLRKQIPQLLLKSRRQVEPKASQVGGDVTRELTRQAIEREEKPSKPQKKARLIKCSCIDCSPPTIYDANQFNSCPMGSG